MLTLTCMLLLLPAVEQRNQVRQFDVDPEKGRHRAKRSVELLRDLRAKAHRAGRLIGGLVVTVRLMIETGLNRIVLAKDQQEAWYGRIVILSLEAHDLALQPRQPMKT